MLYHAGPSSLVFFAECLKIITDSNLQIQSYKIQVQIKPKLHQLWRIALCLSKFHLSVFVKIVWVFWLERVVPPLERRSQMFVYRPFRFSLSLPKACSQARRIYICNRKLSFIDQATNFFRSEIIVTGILSNKSYFCLLIVTFMGPGSHRKWARILSLELNPSA